MNDKGRPDLSIDIAGIKLDNPVIAASGTFGYGSEYAKMIDVSRLGAICTKGLTLNPRPGNEGIRIWETPAGLLNSIGLENPGIEAFIENELPRMKKLGPAIIANLSGSSIQEYAEGAALLDNSSVDMIELNISCPNVKAGGMAFGLDAEAAASVTGPVRHACPHKPLMVKLSPNAPDLTAVARACVNAGADALSLVNTFKAMAIDIKTRRPAFNNISAGLSGPAIRPIALRMVWELYDALRMAGGKQVPIVGMGGIACADDAVEFLMAGAAAIQVGSATFAYPSAMMEIIDGIEDYMRNVGIMKVAGISIR
jgi:dihydroorotate dehydrogenase (NAD+) catalytic subunit